MIGELSRTPSWPEAKHWFDQALVLTRRELRDTLRDWRITIPIILLTMIFPVLMHITAGVAVDWIRSYGGSSLLTERTFPFLLMVVGFFPLSFSLVIALEAFVGEKERKSLEPLLATPLTNGQLYFAKMLASLIPTVAGSYLGMSLYLAAMGLFRGWRPPIEFLSLVVALTTAKAVVMVSGAVVVSSQTTSVRAANLLASFIIIPMTLLVQLESMIMFWANYGVLWWIVALLLVVDLLLIRMGVQLFDREELLGREIDEMSPATIWRTFKRFWRRVDPRGADDRLTLKRIYRRDVPAILRRLRLPVGVILLTSLAAALGGVMIAPSLRLPASVFNPSTTAFGTLQDLPIAFLPVFSGWILLHNLRALALASLLAVFSFGSMAIVVLMGSVGIISFTVAQFGQGGYNPLLFFATFILPHGIFELPGAALVAAAALRLGATVITRQPGMTVGESWLAALVDFVKVFVFVALPLLIIASFVEAVITPQIVMWVYGVK